jgi:hypothetical protein
MTWEVGKAKFAYVEHREMCILLWVRAEVPSVDFVPANGESIEILHTSDLRD